MIETLALYFAPNACSRVPLIALEEAGAPFEARLVAFMAGEHRQPDYLALNPAGKVPTLIVGDTALTQNGAILPYLAHRFPDARLLPEASGPLEQARLAARILWFSADLHPLVTRIRMPQLICDQTEGRARVREMASETMAFQLAETERMLAGRDWVLDSGWSVLDAYLYWVWFRITGAGFDAARFPAIERHRARMEARPAVQRALAREAEAERTLSERGFAVPLA